MYYFLYYERRKDPRKGIAGVASEVGADQSKWRTKAKEERPSVFHVRHDLQHIKVSKQRQLRTLKQMKNKRQTKKQPHRCFKIKMAGDERIELPTVVLES